jgi:hypothetical protein
MTETPLKDSKSSRRSCITALIVALSPFLLLGLIIGGLFVVSSRYNDRQLAQLSTSFSRLTHPQGSRLIATRNEVGQWGNGDHCDLLVAELRSAGGNRQAILNSYRTQRIPVPNDKNTMEPDGKQSVEVEFLPSPLPQNYKSDRYYAKGWDFSRLTGARNLYVVLIINTGDNNAWNTTCDLRCG